MIACITNINSFPAKFLYIHKAYVNLYGLFILDRITAEYTCCAGDTWFADLEAEEMEQTLEISIKWDLVTCEFP